MWIEKNSKPLITYQFLDYQTDQVKTSHLFKQHQIFKFSHIKLQLRTLLWPNMLIFHNVSISRYYNRYGCLFIICTFKFLSFWCIPQVLFCSYRFLVFIIVWKPWFFTNTKSLWWCVQYCTKYIYLKFLIYLQFEI